MTKITRKEAQAAYDAGHPIMSDAEFDARFPENSGSLGEPGKIFHACPMLSQQKCHTAADLQKFMDKMAEAGEGVFRASLKLDGFACSLIYRDGQLVQASTRGDGQYGEDITDAVKKYVNLPPLSIEGRLEVRGEIILPKSQTKPGENPRNIAVGMCKRKALTEDDRWNEFYAYACVVYEVGDVFADLEGLEFLGFKTVPWIPVPREIPAESIIGQFIAWRDSFDAEADGIVVCCANSMIQEELGCTAHHPKWSMAYKFAAGTAISEVLDIEITIGRTGKRTPVAKISPVVIDGAKIQSVSLGSEDVMQDLGIEIGSRVLVTRSGGVIPKIIRVVE